MKRVIFDVPKWSLYLHRAARGMPRADVSDWAGERLQDELFERLFVGDVEALSDKDRDRAYGDWAERVHSTIGQLPVFERLSRECRGRADESAIAVEALMNEIRIDEPDDGFRRSARTACAKATAAIEELREAMEGLEHVALGLLPGTAPSHREPNGDLGGVRSLAARLRESAKLREIAKLAGRFKRIAGAKRRSRVKHGADEIVDIEVGADLSRLLPLELALLVHPSTKLLALRNLVERSALQYRIEGADVLGAGPLVCCIDKSGSMGDGGKDVWATAVALALLDVAKAERRPFALLAFDARVKSEHIVMLGDSLPEDALLIAADGGTDIDHVVRRALEIIEQRPGALRRADVVLITDGGSNSEGASDLRHRAAKLGASVLGIAIEVEPARLEPWCDLVIAAHDMEHIDDRTAEALFGGGGEPCGLV